MRQYIFFLFSITLACLSVCSLLKSENMLENGSFESGKDEKADGWYSGTFGNANAVHKRTADNKKDGNWSYYLEKQDDTGGLQLGYDKKIIIRYQKNKPLSITCRGVYSGNIQEVSLKILFYNRSNDQIIRMKNALDKDLAYNITLKPSSEWKVFSNLLEIPEKTLAEPELIIAPYFYMFQKNRIYIDSLEIYTNAAGNGKSPVNSSDLNGDFSRWQIAEIEPLPDSGKKFYSPDDLPDIRFTIKNGIMYRNNKPFFLLGTVTMGGMQWNSSTIWYPRVFKMDYVDVFHPGGRVMNASIDKNNNLNIGWKDVSWCYTLSHELLRNNIHSWNDMGQQDYKFFGFLTKYREQFPEIDNLMNSRFGHYYIYDHNNSFGRMLYKKTWEAYFKYLGNLPILTTEIFNELGYDCTSPLTLAAFREYMIKKYSTLEELNLILKTSFKTKDDIKPPHIWENLQQDFEYRRYLVKQAHDYPELWYDWMEFKKEFFHKGLQEMRKDFLAVSGQGISIDSRFETHYEQDHYASIDPKKIARETDIFGYHVTGFNFYNYNGPANTDSVLKSIIHAGLYYDFMRTEITNTIINPECIIEGTKSSEENEQFIIERSIIPLHIEWKFRTDPQNAGFDNKWYAEKFNDSDWDRMKVPGLWEEQNKNYASYDGWAWYRIKFIMPKKFETENRDGSVRHMLIGKGLDDSGVIFMNGSEVYRGGSWNGKYAINLNSCLKYGEENTLCIAVHDKELGGGIRFFISLIGDNNLSLETPLNKAQMSALLWSTAVHGLSGICIWFWDGDMVKTFLPEIKNNIDSVAEILMPRPRIKGKIALLYSFETFKGIVNKYPEASDIMDYYGALFFSSMPFDVISGKQFLDLDNTRYPAIIIPYAYYVKNGSWEKLNSYVNSGGVAVLTYNSFIKDDHRFEKLPIENLAGVKFADDAQETDTVLYKNNKYQVKKGLFTGKNGIHLALQGADTLAKYANGRDAVTVKKTGKGKIYFISAELDFYAVNDLITDILKLENIVSPISVASANKREFPFIETRIIERENCFLLYFVNWGGMPHSCNIKLEPNFINKYGKVLYARDVQNSNWEYHNREIPVSSLTEGTISINLDIQMPKVLLFETANSSRQKFRQLSDKRIKILSRIEEMKKEQPSENKPRALFLKPEKEDILFGKLAHPLLVQILEKRGYSVHSLFPQDIAKPQLDTYRIFFLSEDCSLPYKSLKNDFFEAVYKYIENGGKMFLAGSSSPHYNANNILINKLLGKYCKIIASSGFCKNFTACSFNDSLQIKINNFSRHPLVSYINELQLFSATALEYSGNSLEPLMFSGKNDMYFPEKPLAYAGNIGRGKIIVITDNSFCQPFRIEYADNIQFLMNIINWLEEKEIVKYNKNELVDSLLITEKIMEEIEKEENN
ncbi:MAG: hypothetical protein A2096_12855 [Spirochaetes bacterium GWF1_41_5]|nr:MAG: hypothetical protein A2096_12855 [Spirochaetes bacterium GWF1_41_5]